MSTINWDSAANGGWFTGANWDLGRAPDLGDDVSIGVAGAYTVNIPQKIGRMVDVSSLTITDAQATVAVTTASMTVDHDLANAGLLILKTGLTVSGTLNNSGTVDIRSGTVDVQHLSNTGIFKLESGSVTVHGDHVPTTLNSTYDLSGIVYFLGGGKLTSVGATGTLDVDGAAAGLADAVGNPVNDELSQLSSNAGHLSFGDGAQLTNMATAFVNTGTYALYNGVAAGTNAGLNFNNFGTVNVDAGHAQGGSTFTIGGTLINRGTLQVGDSDGSLASDSTITASVLNNTATIDLFGSNHGRASLIDLGDSAPSDLLPGTFFNLSGNALLEFTSGDIASIATNSGISIDGRHAFIANAGDTASNSALNDLANNAGTLTLGDRAVLANAAQSFSNSGVYTLFNSVVAKTSFDFTNSGNVSLDSDAGQGGSTLTAAGALTNNDTITIGNAGLTLSDKVVAGVLHNSGTISLEGAADDTLAQMVVRGATDNIGDVTVGAFSTLTSASYGQAGGETDVWGTLTTTKVTLQDGILQGGGTIDGNLAVTGGEVAGGSFADASLGTLTVTGTFSDISTLDATLVAADGGSASLIDVLGSKALIRGATLHLDIVDADNLSVGETFTILTFAPGVLKGQFGAITDGVNSGDGNSLDLGNGLTLDAVYDNAGGTVQLSVVETPPPDIISGADHFGAAGHAAMLLLHHGLDWF